MQLCSTSYLEDLFSFYSNIILRNVQQKVMMRKSNYDSYIWQNRNISDFTALFKLFWYRDSL